MEKKNHRNEIILSFLGLVFLILITLGVTYAAFNYTKLGSTENTVTTGTIKFLYNENTGVGSGIKLENALPVEDSTGKSYATEGMVFDFKVEGTNTSNEIINYELTLRKKANSTLLEEAIKVYLTDMTDNADTEILAPTKFQRLVQTNLDVEDNIEKTLYQGTVPGNTNNYLKNFRLRMWISNDIDFSTGDYSGKNFTVTVNVYASVPTVIAPIEPTYKSYNVGDSVTGIDGSKWHVLENSDKNNANVTLLSDYNLNSAGEYDVSCGAEINSQRVCSPLAYDPDKTVAYDENDNNNIGYFIKRNYEPKVLTALPNSTNITILTVEQIMAVEGETFGDGVHPLKTPWLLTTAYWTKTVCKIRENSVMQVDGNQLSYSFTDSQTLGVRPVITTPKSNLTVD